jgi:UDP-glucose 4-epimerase
LSFDLPVVVVRPFNTYGPREHLEGAYGEVIPRFVLRVMNGLPPIIFGDGQQTRDFTEVHDIVTGIVAAGECDRLIGDSVNIAAGREVSIKDIANIIIRTLGKDGEIEPTYMEERPGDVKRHYADITKAQKVLDFQPQVGIEKGIQNYINWVKRQSWDISQLQREQVIVNWRE